LQYFNEELVPHGLEAMRPYLDEAVEGDITSADIQQLQQFLREVEIRYAELSSIDGQPDNITLYCTAEEAANASSDRSGHVARVARVARVAVVLIPPMR
jgi:hypothetical protein